MSDIVSEAVPTSSDPGFFMNKLGLLGQAKAGDEDKMRKYMQQLKEECGQRLLHVLYNENTGKYEGKYWIALGRRPFLGHKFSAKSYI